jgi:hypothetical protein
MQRRKLRSPTGADDTMQTYARVHVLARLYVYTDTRRHMNAQAHRHMHTQYTKLALACVNVPTTQCNTTPPAESAWCMADYMRLGVQRGYRYRPAHACGPWQAPLHACGPWQVPRRRVGRVPRHFQRDRAVHAGNRSRAHARTHAQTHTRAHIHARTVHAQCTCTGARAPQTYGTRSEGRNIRNQGMDNRIKGSGKSQ